MKKRTDSNNYNNKMAVDIKGLCEMMSLGRNSCMKLGEDAGAVIRVGRRKLYSVEKIREYIENQEDVE